MGKRVLEAIVFDFDGTLAKLNIDFAMMKKSLSELISSYGVPAGEFSDLFALEMIEAGRRWLTERSINRDGYAEKTSRLIRDIEMEGARQGGLIGGVREMLTGLSSRGIKTAVVTRNCREAVTALFPDIGSYCGAVITREETFRVKPEPEHLRIALASIGAVPPSSAMVGDHPMDIEIGKKVGTWTIGVLTGYYNREGLMDAGADLVIESASDILDYI